MKQQKLVADPVSLAKQEIENLLQQGWHILPETLQLRAPAPQTAYALYLAALLEKETD